MCSASDVMTTAAMLAVALLSLLVLLVPGASALLSPRGLRVVPGRGAALYARAAKPVDSEGRVVEVGGAGAGADAEGEEEMITLPFDGLVNKEGGLFNKALDVLDPLQAAYDKLPGAEGSQERRDAIDKLIKARVEMIESDNYNRPVSAKNPIEGMSFWEITWSTVKVCKPFETTSELVLTYMLLNLAMVLFTAYALSVNSLLGGALDWFIKTDFAGTDVGSLLKL